VGVDQLDDCHRAEQEEQNLRQLAHVVGELLVDPVLIARDDVRGPARDAHQQRRRRLVQSEGMLEDDGQVSKDEQRD
jgi:hypothetical protein